MRGLLLVAATAVALRIPATPRGRTLTRRYTTTSDIAELRREIEVLEDDLLRDRWARATSHTATAGCDTIASLLGTTEQQAVSLLLDSGATTVEADACTYEDYRSALRHLKAHRGAYAAPAAAPVATAEDAAPPAWERAVAMSTYASPLAQSAPLLSVLCFSFGYEPLARSVGAAYESYVEHVPLLLAAVLVGAAACDFSDVKVPKLVRVSALQAFILYGYEALAELVLMFTSPSMEQAIARFTAIVLACAFTISSGAAAVGAGSGQVVELGWISILARAMTTDEDE
jgi:hypothetical protein